MPATTEYIITGLDSNTEYDVTVSATNIFGEGADATKETLFTKNIPTWTDVALDPTVIINVADATKIDISWSVPNVYDASQLSYQVLF